MNEPSLDRSEILDSEKRRLRACGIKLKEIHQHSIAELSIVLGVAEIRAMELRATSEFQSIPSIGKRFAEDLMQLGFYSLEELRGQDPAKLLNRLELQIGAWIDPGRRRRCLGRSICCEKIGGRPSKKPSGWLTGRLGRITGDAPVYTMPAPAPGRRLRSDGSRGWS